MSVFEQGLWFTRLISAVTVLGFAALLFGWGGVYLLAIALAAAAILGIALLTCRCAVCGKPAHLRDGPWGHPYLGWVPEEYCSRCHADLASEHI